MKRQRSISKSVLSLCLAILLTLQVVVFPIATYAESAITDSGAAVSDSDSPEASEPPASEEVAPAESPVPEESAVPEESQTPESEEAAVPSAGRMSIMAAPADKTTALQAANPSFLLEVKQAPEVGKPEVIIPAGATLHGRLPFSMSLTDVKVPVLGDNQNAEEESIIKKGDKVIFDKATYFPLVNLTATGNKNILVGTQKIATANFSATAITITFDGDDTFFNGVKRDVKINLTFTAKADVSEIGYGDKELTEIFGASYNIDNPSLTPAYSISINPLDSNKPSQYAYVNLGKTSFVEGTITWQVNVAAFDKDDNTLPLPLDGKTFYSDPSKGSGYNAAGVYVADSFKVNGQTVTPVYADGALSYTFPESFGDKATITFKTWIPKNLYYYEYQPVPGGDGGQKMDILAQLKDESQDELVKAGSYRVNIYPDWIQQSGVVSKQGNDTLVTWAIHVNQNYFKQGLKNFTITDALPAGLSFVSAAYQLWDTGTNGWSATTTPIIPTGANNDTYSIPDGENKAVRLVIVSKVESGNNFTNWARANWSLDNPPSGLQDNDATVGNNPATVSAFATVAVGAHTLTKSSALTDDDLKIGATTWTVSLTPQYEDPASVVYDLLVYSRTANFLDPAKLDSKGKVDAAVLTRIVNDVKGNKELIGQQYLKDSFTTSANLQWEVIPLYQDDVQVADLLKVSGYTDKQASFTFRTLMTDPEQFASQYSKSSYASPRYNRVYLFDGDRYTNISAQNYANRHGNMLEKGMLFASKPLKADGTPENVIPNNVNNYITNDNNEAWTIAGYDRVNKTITFRLAVNHKGLDTVEMAKYGGNRVASDIKLVDTLPAGWEFVPYDESGKLYELYQGFSSNGSNTSYGTLVRADNIIPPDSADHVVSFSHTGNVGTFTFSKLVSPYVIFVKARPTSDTISAELAAGKSRHEGVNTAELSIKWGDVETKYTESRKAIVPLNSVSKSVIKPAPGIQEWTVNYAPAFSLPDDVFLQDTLGAGLKLRKDESGKLSLTIPDMAVYRATMTPSGALARDGAAIDLTDPDAEVTVEMEESAGNPTKLIFKMKNPNQFYQFVYQTESSGMAQGTVGNKIELLGDENLPTIEASSTIPLDASDVSGSAGSNGVLYILKVDPGTKPLPGVQFTLYEADGVTEAKDQQGQTIQGTTDAGGKLMLLIPKSGLYQLKQTQIDLNTYLPTTTIYPVRVADVKDSPTFAGGELVTVVKPLVVPTPVWPTGQLKLETAIEGQGADPTKDFEYTITFSNGKSYPYSGSKNGTVASGGTVTLKGGQAVTIENIPEGITYTIVQNNYTSEGYTTDPAGFTSTGSIVAEQTAEAKYINARYLPGKLTIGQKVAGNGGQPNKQFEFTVTFGGEGASGEYAYTKPDGTPATIKSGDKISLKHGEVIEINGIPKETTYTIIEDDYTSDGYTTSWPDWTAAGTIIDGGDHREEVVNTRMVYGGLLIGQTVEGKGADENKAFEYTVTFGGADADETFTYTKSDNTTGTIKSGGKITLKHEETVAIEGIPSGYSYTVTETDYTGEGYTTDPASRIHSGTIVEQQIAEARFVNTKYLPGKLVIGQTVAGNGGQPDKEFEFTVAFGGAGADEEYTYAKSDGTTGTIKSGGKIVLKHGETVTIDGISKDTTYTVTETDYSGDGYTTDPVSLTHAGTITEGDTAEALFVNTRMVYGSLTIGETVAGNGGDRNKVFEFTVTFEGEGASGEYAYTKPDGTPATVKSGEKISLKHGETVTINGIPASTTYTVTETNYTSDGYTANWPDWTASGTITENATQEALFVNTRLIYGGLLIGQTVEGKGADENKAFEYTVTFGGAGADEEYTYTKSDGTTGTIKSGGTILLKHGEVITIAATDILDGTTYTVTETDYTGEGYTTDPASRIHSGTIVDQQIAEARFVNTKYLPGKLVIGQTVAGNGGQPDKEFEFTVAFGGAGADEEYAYTKPDGTPATIQSGGKIVLKHGETVTIDGISKDTTYTVTETDYSEDGYTTDPVSLTHAGTITEGDTAEALFVNTRMVYGSLTIGETVAGNGGDKNKMFEFTLIFEGEGQDESYAYTGTGISSGSLKSGDKIRLKHGEQITFPALPKGMSYKVVEAQYTSDGYTANWPDWTASGTITENGKHEALFVNTRLIYGGLLIGQTVEGKGADENKAFEYTVTFGGAGADEEYTYTKSDGTTGTIKSGGTILLKHGEVITIAATDILDGTTYTVTETDYTDEGYTTDPASRIHSGTIVEQQIAEARFVNTKYLPGKLVIGQTVAGNGGQPDKEFEFTVAFGGAGADEEYTYAKSDGTTGTIKSGGKIVLKHGETVTIDGISKDTTYTVTETDYSGDGYTTDPVSLTHAGTITEGDTAEALFVNTRAVYGSLTIGETVAGNGGDKNKVFEFTVTFEGEGASGEYAYTKPDGTPSTVKSGEKISLKHGETVTINGILKGTIYTVTEADYTSDGYTANWPDWTASGTIAENATQEALFVNTRLIYGGLLIGQTVEGKGADENKAFEYTVTFGGAGADEEYTYTKSDGTTGTIKSGGTILLKHGEVITIAATDILDGTTYTVTETDYTDEGYTTDPASRIHSGTIVEQQIAEARFVNTKYLPGKLVIGQTVAGNGGQPDKEFEFMVAFGGAGADEEYTYAKSDGTTGTIKSGGKIVLKHGETVTIDGISKDITYTVTETDYSEDGYTTDPVSLTHAGTITEGDTAEALFVNTRAVYGSLTIGETVAGNGGDRNKVFEFTVTFEGEGASGEYAYTKPDGTPATVKSGEKISLKHGETVTINGIPASTTYTVTETNYASDGYTANWPDWTASGTIVENGKHEALFVNTRMVYGGLLIGQTVEGSGADKHKAFEFTVTFDSAGTGDEYTYTKSDGTTGTIKSGGKIALKHGETAAIEGIPSGYSYTVTETDYSGEGYTVNPANRVHNGTIVEQRIAEARFVNAKYLPGKLTLTADPETVPGNGKTPSQLTATLTDYEGKPVANTEVIFTLPDQSEVRATTDAQGKAKIPYTPPKLEATTAKEHEITARVNSLTEGSLVATTTVTAVPAAITGVLRDNTTGEIIPNANIIITNDATGEKHTITTSATGEYFLLVPYGGEYTISFTKMIKINGADQPITFTQQAEVGNDVKGGELVPAHITAVGIVLLKQPEGQSSMLNSAFTDKMHIYLKDEQGNYIEDANGKPKAFSLQPNGTFLVDGLSAEKYTMEVRYEVAPGKELTLIRDAELNVGANGELNISQELVDPYGLVTDERTGAIIEGAEVTLYYADTQRNREKGIEPGTKVTLPAIPGFAPNDNASPSQNSDATGSYAYMVYPDTDYFLIVTKTGYYIYRSTTISVGSDIVRYDVQMKPTSSEGGGQPGPVEPEPGEGNNGTDNGNNGTGEGNNGTDNGNNGTGEGNNGTDNGNNGTGEGNNGTDNGNNGTGEGNNGTDNGNNGTGEGNNGTGNGNNGTGEGNNGTGEGNNGTGNGNNGTGEGSNETDNGNKGTGNNGANPNDDELDNVPKTGDNSTSPVLYMILALISLMALGFSLRNSNKNQHIQ